MTSLTQPQPPGEQARTLVAFVGEDEQLDHVRDAAVALAVRDGARLILYDRDAASAFADPLPNQWASTSERAQYGDPLSDEELVKLGREPFARKVADARRVGVDAWGWLAEHHGTDALVDYARRHCAEAVLLPAELDDPGLTDRLKRETAAKAVDEATEAEETEETGRGADDGDGLAVLLVGPDGSVGVRAPGS
jgi:hypothetical protein